MTPLLAKQIRAVEVSSDIAAKNVLVGNNGTSMPKGKSNISLGGEDTDSFSDMVSAAPALSGVSECPSHESPILPGQPKPAVLYPKDIDPSGIPRVEAIAISSALAIQLSSRDELFDANAVALQPGDWGYRATPCTTKPYPDTKATPQHINSNDNSN